MKVRRKSSYGEENHNKMHAPENENSQNTKVSTLRIIASQLLALCPIIFIRLRIGMGYGYTSVLVPELDNSKENAEIYVSLDELTWFSSYCFVIPVASVSGGYLAQYLGVRRLLMFSCLLHISADLLFHWADSVAMILFAQVLVGFTSGTALGPSYTYIAETLQPKYRSTTMAAMGLFTSFGAFFATLLGNFMHWRIQTIVLSVFPAIGFVFIQFIPDSPQWLASKSRFEEAEISLARLRGWTTPEAVKEELYSSLINASDATSLTETTPENDLHSDRGTKLKQALSLYFDRSFYIPLLTMTAMFFFAEFSGANVLSVYSILIFEEIKSPISGNVASAILPACHIISAFIYIFSVRFLGKRILTLASVFVTAVCFLITATLLYLTNSNLIASDIYSWVISIALISASFALRIGLGKVVYILNSELFPQRLRYVGAGIGLFLYEIMIAISAKIFLYIVKAITLPGTLIAYVIINIISFIVIYFILPETEGITLLQIEERYASKQNLKKHSPLKSVCA